MSKFDPTPSQALAINEQGRSLLVSAAAGSGKTKVLTERLLARISGENGADIDSFLIITFTKAAAAELRGRITQEIAERLAETPGSDRLRRQSALCQRAQIGTIHSFCQTLLRENCQAAGLSPEFRVIEEDRAGAIRARVIEKVMDAAYEQAEPGFLLLADTVGIGRDDSTLVELVLDLHRKMQSHAEPEVWAQGIIDDFEKDYSDVAETPWGQELMGDLREKADFWAKRLLRLFDESEADPRIAAAYGPALADFSERFADFSAALGKGWDAARSLTDYKHLRMNTPKGMKEDPLALYIKDVDDRAKKEWGRIADTVSADSEKLLADMRKTAPAMKALLNLTLDFDRAYLAEKKRRSELDFSDLEHMAYRLLTEHPEVAAAQAMRFTEIMVDEYQDVNAVQDAIFRLVSRNGKNLFMVGDVKQSIYRFRLADPTIFTKKYKDFAEPGAPSGEPVRILLQENFRSRREVLAAANHIFRCCISEKLGDIDYDENAELKYGARDYPDAVPVPELLLIEPPFGFDGNKHVLEARTVAKRIKKLVADGISVTDRDGQRPVRYGDIAVLMRSANRLGEIYRRELTAEGIPVLGGSGGSFFASTEISTVTSLLAVLDNPHQDVPLIAVLRSAAFGFTADELSAVRAEDRDADFCTALMKHAETNEKSAGFIKKLNDLRDLARDMELGQLIWRLYDELELFALCAAMRDGEARCANLRLFPELALRFEATGQRGLHRFLDWLERLYERGEEPTRSESGNAVTIMTVHKSKGLEFPVVFLCNTAGQFNRMDTNAPVLVHPELGLGPKITDTGRGVSYSGLTRNAIRSRAMREMLSEEMRLLYVALTRAKERLFMSAVANDFEKELQKLMPYVGCPVEPEILMRSNSPAEWLMLSYLDCDKKGILRLSTPSVREEDTETAQEECETVEASPALVAALRQRLAFRYEREAATKLPSKLTATELKHFEEPDTEAQTLTPARRSGFRTPELLRGERPLSPTERGIATHTVLQYIDYAKTETLADIEGEIKRLRDAHFISERQAEAVNAGSIWKLFKSHIGLRILNADKLLREFKFSLLCRASDFFEGGGEDEILLQGVMDCCIEESGELTVVDYKTDRVFGEALQERAESYRGQLRAYAVAAERMTGKPVKECVLYFLHAGREVHLA